MCKKILSIFTVLIIILSFSSCKRGYKSKQEDGNLLDVYLCTKIIQNEINKNYYKEYTYDRNLNITQLVYYENGDESSRYEYEYDSRGNLVKKIHLTNEWYGTIENSQEYKYEYDSEGNIVQETTYENGYKTYYVKYSTIDQLVRTVTYNGDNLELRRTEYKYDENGNLIQKITYDDAREVSNIEYSYDNNGNLIIERENSFPPHCYEYEYEFSENSCTMRETVGDTTSLYIYKKVRIREDQVNDLRKKHGNTLVLIG